MYRNAFKTEEEWNAGRVDSARSFQGHNNSWTKRLKVYDPIDKPQTYPDGDVTELEMPFWRRITDPAWVEQYVHMLGKFSKNLENFRIFFFFLKT